MISTSRAAAKRPFDGVGGGRCEVADPVVAATLELVDVDRAFDAPQARRRRASAITRR